jgi:hypothetical protein
VRPRAVHKIGKSEITFGVRDIAVKDKKGYLLYWHESEWIADPQVVFSIVNAIRLASLGNDMEKLVTLFPGNAS